MGNLKVTAKIEKTAEGSLTVRTTWVNFGGPALDRTAGLAFGLKATHGTLAARLVRAIEAGVVFVDPSIERDINGATYVVASSRVLGRTLNADLRRLGF